MSIAHQRRTTWLDETACRLVGMFQKNFRKFEQTVDSEVKAAAPQINIAAE